MSSFKAPPPPPEASSRNLPVPPASGAPRSQYGFLVHDQHVSAAGPAMYDTVPQQEGNVLRSYGDLPNAGAPLSHPRPQQKSMYGELRQAPAGPSANVGYGDIPQFLGNQGVAPGYGVVPDEEGGSATGSPVMNSSGKTTPSYGMLPDNVWKPNTANSPAAAATVTPGHQMYGGLPAISAGGGGNRVPVSSYYDSVALTAAAGNPSSAAAGYGQTPPEAQNGQSAWQPALDEHGQRYYYNRLTGETSWTRPDQPPSARSEYQHVSTAASVAAAAAAATAAKQRAAGTQEVSGWLVKGKGKKRWFVLRGKMLFWFNKEMPANCDVMAALKNFLPLDNVVVQRNPPKNAQEMSQHAILLQPINTMKVKNPKGLVLIADTAADMQRWMAALEDAVTRSRSANTHAGVLTMGKKRKWVCIEDGQFKWYKSDKKESLQGCVDLGRADVGRTKVQQGVLEVVSPFGMFEFQCAHPQEFAVWSSKLSNAIRDARQGNDLMTSVRRRKQSKNSLTDSTEDPAHMDGSNSLTHYDWYHGQISGDKAYNVLAHQPVGAYLVRTSSKRGHFVISWVQTAGIVVHTLCSPQPHGGWLIEGDSQLYSSIPEILHEYAHSYTHHVSNGGKFG